MRLTVCVTTGLSVIATAAIGFSTAGGTQDLLVETRDIGHIGHIFDATEASPPQPASPQASAQEVAVPRTVKDMVSEARHPKDEAASLRIMRRGGGSAHSAQPSQAAKGSSNRARTSHTKALPCSQSSAGICVPKVEASRHAPKSFIVDSIVSRMKFASQIPWPGKESSRDVRFAELGTGKTWRSEAAYNHGRMLPTGRNW